MLPYIHGLDLAQDLPARRFQIIIQRSRHAAYWLENTRCFHHKFRLRVELRKIVGDTDFAEKRSDFISHPTNYSTLLVGMGIQELREIFWHKIILHILPQQKMAPIMD